MSTPETKLESAAASVSAEIAKVKSVWARWEIYAVALAGAIVGGGLVHFLHL
jgi:hypothetical protein